MVSSFPFFSFPADDLDLSKVPVGCAAVSAKAIPYPEHSLRQHRPLVSFYRDPASQPEGFIPASGIVRVFNACGSQKRIGK